jgi:hypothetical protein
VAGSPWSGVKGARRATGSSEPCSGAASCWELEFLVAANIIRTVAVQPSLQNVAVLGLIMLIRTFLSFSLEVEIDGRWPWRRAALEGAASLSASPASGEPGGS